MGVRLPCPQPAIKAVCLTLICERDNIMLAADPKIGVSGLGGCGVIGSQCQPNIDCEDWVSRGFGTHYWVCSSLFSHESDH